MLYGQSAIFCAKRLLTRRAIWRILVVSAVISLPLKLRAIAINDDMVPHYHFDGPDRDTSHTLKGMRQSAIHLR